MSPDTRWFHDKRIELTDLNREDRRILRPIVGACLAGALAFVLVFGLVKCAIGAEVFRGIDDRGGQMVLKLYPEKCTNEAVLAHLVRGEIAPEAIATFKKATLFYWGREWASCWIEAGGRVYSVDEEGAMLRPLPRSVFKNDSV